MEEAVSAAYAAMSLDEGDFRPAIVLAGLYEAMEDYDNARKFYLLAVSLSPESAFLHNAVGNFCYDLGKKKNEDALVEESLSWYQKALELQQEPVLYQNLGNAYAWLGEYTRAIESYDKALLIDPSHLETLAGKAAALKDIGQFAEALDIYRRVHEERPGDAYLLFEMGDLYFVLGDYPRAIKCFREAKALDPSFLVVEVFIASCYARMGELEKALRTLQGYIEKVPENPRAYLERAKVLLLMRREDEAVEDMKRAVATKPEGENMENPSYQFFLLEAYRECIEMLLGLERYMDAEQFMEEGLALFPEETEWLYQKANLCAMKDRLPEAVALFREVLRREPEFDRAKAGLAQAYRNQGKIQAAVKLLDEYIQNNPEPEAYLCAGDTLLDGLRDREALGYFQKAAKLAPRNDECFGQLGYTLRELGEYDKALNALSIATKLNPGALEWYSSICFTLYLSGKQEAAYYCADEIIEKNPREPAGYFARGALLSQDGETALASEMFDKALSLDPNFLDAIYEKGRLLFETGHYKEAILCFLKCLKISPQYLMARLSLSDVYVGLGETKEALRVLDEAREMHPERPDVYFARGNILNSEGRYEEAVKEYDLALSFKKEWPDIYFAKANALENLGLLEEADAATEAANQLLEEDTAF